MFLFYVNSVENGKFMCYTEKVNGKLHTKRRKCYERDEKSNTY